MCKFSLLFLIIFMQNCFNLTICGPVEDKTNAIIVETNIRNYSDTISPADEVESHLTTQKCKRQIVMETTAAPVKARDSFQNSSETTPAEPDIKIVNEINNTVVIDNDRNNLETSTALAKANDTATTEISNQSSASNPVIETTTTLIETTSDSVSKESEILETTTESIVEQTTQNKIATNVENTPSARMEKSIPIDKEDSEEYESNPVGQGLIASSQLYCGAYLGRRISFGVETTLFEYPWSALLIYDTTERFHCGGSLITNRYVLTAAHCVTEHFYPLIAVRLGEHNISSTKDCAPSLTGELICSSDPIDAGVEKVIMHSKYSRRTHKNDIALIRLDQNIEYTRSHFPICLPLPNENFSTLSNAVITGWGATEKSISSNVLMKAEIPVLDINECSRIYRSFFSDDKEICASGATEVDVCKGDSGGPLFTSVYRSRRTRSVQVGVTSLGVASCGDKRYLPAVFTRVTSYMKWIENKLEE
uniref:Peptidase S1 domain-containing protein n=1 Tax=Glossina brevipalpis TaxID=37001 RepID=A0A1A9W0H2_9MUSC